MLIKVLFQQENWEKNMWCTIDV